MSQIDEHYQALEQALLEEGEVEPTRSYNLLAIRRIRWRRMFRNMFIADR